MNEIMHIFILHMGNLVLKILLGNILEVNPTAMGWRKGQTE